MQEQYQLSLTVSTHLVASILGKDKITQPVGLFSLWLSFQECSIAKPGSKHQDAALPLLFSYPLKIKKELRLQ